MQDHDEAAPAELGMSSARPRLGEALRTTREFRRISVEHASELLRIEPQFLIALEEERFAAIGPPVFVKGYLKHYCALLGLDPRPLLDELRERLDREEPALAARQSAEYEHRRPQLGIFLAGGIAAVAAVFVLWQLAGWAFNLATSEPDERAAEGSVSAAAEPGQTASGGRNLLNGDASNGDPSLGDPSATDAGGESPYRESVYSDAVLGATVEDVIDLPPQTTSGLPGRSPSAATPATAAERATAESATIAAAATTVPAAPAAREAAPASVGDDSPLEIELLFAEDSWTEVSSASGGRLLYGLYRAGAAERIGAEEGVSVLLGNADGVDIRVNGEPFTYPAGSRRGETARFRLSPPEE